MCSGWSILRKTVVDIGSRATESQSRIDLVLALRCVEARVWGLYSVESPWALLVGSFAKLSQNPSTALMTSMNSSRPTGFTT